jgi:hypothetical protein
VAGNLVFRGWRYRNHHSAGARAQSGRRLQALLGHRSEGWFVMGWEPLAGAAVALLLAVLGWVWKLSGKMATQDGRIEAANIVASNASAKATILNDDLAALNNDLAAHKEHVAAEYVSRSALNDVTQAINRLADRLDSLFLHFMPTNK